MKAIQVRYLGATDTLGTRLRASAEGVKSITVSRDYSLNVWEQTDDAARQLANKYGWLRGHRLVQGTLPNGDDVYVLQQEIN